MWLKVNTDHYVGVVIVSSQNSNSMANHLLEHGFAPTCDTHLTQKLLRLLQYFEFTVFLLCEQMDKLNFQFKINMV